MKTFSDLAIAFSAWQQENNISNNVDGKTKYIWIIPEQALSTWKNELDDQEYNFTDEELKNYKSMFRIGGKILGILISDTNNTNIAQLYQLGESPSSFVLEDVLCSKDQNILANNLGETSNLPVAIKHQTIGFDDVFGYRHGRYDAVHVREGASKRLFEDVFDGIDQPYKPTRGIIAGMGYVSYGGIKCDCEYCSQFEICDDCTSRTGCKYYNKDMQSCGMDFEYQFCRDQHWLKNITEEYESILGAIDYNTGNLHIVRANQTNEEKFKQYYNELKDIIENWTTLRANPIPPYELPEPYNYATITGTFVTLGDPKLIFEFDISNDE